MILFTSFYAIVAAAIGYLIGSIPFGLLLTRYFGAGDIRQIGSGNIGATNVLRTGRKDLAAATLALDMLKGTFAYFLVGWLYSRALDPSQVLTASLDAAAAAFFGHIYPYWLDFKGGKGVATYLGGLIAASLPGAIAFAATWLAVAGVTRRSSAAALAASVAAPAVILFYIGDPQTGAVFAVMSLMLWLKHEENIKRLIAGAEPKIGEKR